MGSLPDKTKLKIAGVAIGIMTIGVFGMNPSTDSNVINNQNYTRSSTVQNYDEEISNPQSNVQKDITISEGSGTYTGDIVDGMKHDNSARFVFTNGYIYEGSFIHNQIEGKGKLIIPKVGTYEGNFSNGLRSGTGTMLFVNGEKYQGEWSNDQMSGKGTYTFPNGDSYVGQFSNNKYNGTGTYTVKSTGKTYSGTWLNNNYKQ